MIFNRLRNPCRRALLLLAPVLLSQTMAALASVLQSQTVAAQATTIHAKALIKADSATRAVALLKAAIEAGPDSAAYHVWLAAAYTDLGSQANFFRQFGYVRRIRGELQRAVALDSNSVDAHSELSRFYLTAPGILGGSLSRAESEARKIATLSASRSHGLLGYIAHHRGDLKTAEREMRSAITAQPDSAWPYTALAFLLTDEQRNDEAFSLWEKSVSLDSTFRNSYLQMGAIGATTGTHLAQAAVALEHYVTNPPGLRDTRNVASAYNKLGHVYEKQGRTTDARRAYEKAIALAPNSSTYKASLKALG
ncbi:MAG: tetratricopeptide repeat protein [Gemmatimonadota bacterium]|nr:tetratricopeptide repeat protein [Gemmatimonadota bacterium]